MQYDYWAKIGPSCEGGYWAYPQYERLSRFDVLSRWKVLAWAHSQSGKALTYGS